MKTLALVVAAALAASAGGVLAGENPATKAVAKPAGAAKAVRMTDADLDRVVAGKVTIVETGFNTWLVNPGKASVGIVHRNGSFTCINLCGVPPPPPPPGGGGGGN
jgi:hypothetical protein